MYYAPIVVITYNRLEYLKRLVDSLSKCDHVKDHPCYFFSDAPSWAKKGDVQRVSEVRRYLEKVRSKGIFSKTELYFAPEHKGLRNNVIDAITEVLKSYDRVIDLEDDLVVSEDFLNYMDAGLEYFASDMRVSSITGNTPSLKVLDTRDIPGNVFFLRRFSSWSFGVWKNRWELVDWELCDYEELISDKMQQDAFSEIGYDLPYQIAAIAEGMVDNWAAIFAYMAFKKHMYTVYPRYSKAINIGTYGSNATGQLIEQDECIKNTFTYDFSRCDFYKDCEIEYRTCLFSRQEYLTRQSYGFIEKYNRQYHLLHRWMSVRENGRRMEKLFLAKGWRRIGIYGAGELGKHLWNEFNGTRIEIAFFIDVKGGEYEGIPIYYPQKILERADVIIITPVFAYRNIERMLKGMMISPIVSLEKLFFL